MKKPLLICLTLSLALSAIAQEPKSKVLGTYYFDQKDRLVTLDGQSVYKFENTNDTQLQIQLVKILRPQLSITAYAITGRIKYENVQGAGYLEMWNFFPPTHPGMPEGQYFSRTLDESGEMGKITGTCDWRDFSLPFDPTGASGAPTRLEINLILPGRGTVYLTPVKLVKYSAGFTFSSEIDRSNSWWSPRLSAIYGGIGGSFFGCLVALIGCLAGIGKARRFVMAMAKLLTALGVLLTIAGIVAVACEQPYAIWYPLLLAGVILAAVCGAILPAIKKRYEDLEIRRMASMDAAGS